MGYKWATAPLNQFVDDIFKGVVPLYTTSNEVHTASVIGQKCIRDFDLDVSNARKTDLDHCVIRPKKFVRPLDILINATGVGSAGRVAQALHPYPNTVTDAHVITLRTKGINPAYLGYALKSEQCRIEQLAQGSTGQVEVNRARLLDEIFVSYPRDRKSQSTIALVFANVDREIAALSHLITCNFKLLQTLFEEFNSHANVLWQKGGLTDIATFKNGLVMAKYPPTGEGDLPVLKIRELRRGRTTADSERCSATIPASAIVHNGDVVFSWATVLLVDLWMGGVAGLNQHLYKVTSDTYPTWFYYLWIDKHLPQLTRQLYEHADQPGNLTHKDLAAAEVLIPPHDVLMKQHSVMQPIVEEILSLKQQLNSFVELRERLMPLFVHGEVEADMIHTDILKL